MTLTDAAPTKKIDAEMKTGSVTLVFKVDPPPTLFLDGKPWKGDKSKIEGVSAGEEHKLVIAANGYMPKTIQFTAAQGETKMITEHLVRMEPGGGCCGARGRPRREGQARGGERGEGRGGVRPGEGPRRRQGRLLQRDVNGTPYGPTPVEAQVSSGNVRVSCKPASGARCSKP